MKSFLSQSMALLAGVAICVSLSNIAAAGWGSSGGYSGGSSGGAIYVGYGSYGGSSGGSHGAYYGGSSGGYGGSSGGYGSYYASYYGGSSGGGGITPVRSALSALHNLHDGIHNRIASHRAARQSYGSSGGGYAAYYGSSGGSSGYSGYMGGSSGSYINRIPSYGSSGGYAPVSYGSSGHAYSTGYGSSGHAGASYVAPYYGAGVDRNTGNYLSSNARKEYEPTYSPNYLSSLQASTQVSRAMVDPRTDEVHISVSVPDEARVFVNGNPTKSTGDVRHFVSRGLKIDNSYRFDIRAEVERSGTLVTETKSLTLTPGQVEQVSFALVDPQAKAETVLKLHVPERAQVVLAGSQTSTKGEARTYRTTELAAGEMWDDYQIVVTVDGVTKEQMLRLIGGDHLELTFNFDEQPANEQPASDEERLASL